jgi:hypothetical protein
MIVKKSLVLIKIRFEDLTTPTVKSTAFSDITPYSPVEVHGPFGVTHFYIFRAEE